MFYFLIYISILKCLAALFFIFFIFLFSSYPILFVFLFSLSYFDSQFYKEIYKENFIKFY